MPLTTTPVLPYSDAPSRWGVVSERRETGLRVIVPPLSTLKYLPRGYLWILLPLAAMVMMAGEWKALKSEPGAMLGPLAMYAAVVVGIAAHAISLLRRRIVFDVTCEHVSVGIVPASGFARRVSWPRDKIADVGRNASSGKLEVSITGEDTREYYLGPSPEVTQYVADIVRSAVFDGHFGPETSDTRAFPWPDAKLRAQRVLFTINRVACVGMTLGLALMLFADWRGVGCVALGLSMFILMISAGMSMGTQDKELFL